MTVAQIEVLAGMCLQRMADHLEQMQILVVHIHPVMTLLQQMVVVLGTTGSEVRTAV